ncbi:uncharacterized protein E0L32_004167 [Thyridium curvatum]|uniref:Cytochrome P450 n=1 Tax=Thyridium curvatum TaxID=1093900 RepID=A0A507B1L9_9PEZI|nr:uncharacterized protein E0L32_004167 [Thyridium curvatum]TPX16172.1 hypothetical protein E0L32_004167 [Thyridium curvatum]
MSESSLKLVEPTVRAKAKLTIDRMQQEMRKRGVADIYKWCLFYTTDVIGELSFGESFRMLEIGQKNTYVEDLENVSRRGGIRAGLPELAFIARYIPLPFMSSAVESGKRFHQYSTESIQRYKRLVAADPNTPATLFSKLFRAGEEGMSDEEIISTGQGYIVAGSDTTSNTLTYLLWTVCRSPQTKAALLAELATLPADFGADALRELPYLNQVIEETLRLYSQVPGGLPRVVPPGGAYMAGHWVPPGTTVSAQAYTVHRNPGVFPRPEVFEPSRWAAPTKAMTDSFVPFGGGSRICIGLHLARMELRLGTALFFLRFPNARVSTKEGMSDGDMETILYFLMAPKGNRCLLELE